MYYINQNFIEEIANVSDMEEWALRLLSKIDKQDTKFVESAFVESAKLNKKEESK